MGVKQVLGTINGERGVTNEYKVLEGIQELTSKPKWYRRSRHATKHEDSRGIDLVIETDIGSIFLQVKSSKRGAEVFTQKQRKSMIGIIVVRGSDSLDRLGERALGVVGRLRSQILASRL